MESWGVDPSYNDVIRGLSMFKLRNISHSKTSVSNEVVKQHAHTKTNRDTGSIYLFDIYKENTLCQKIQFL